MSSPPDLLSALRAAGLTVQADAPLAPRTWWQVGGPADLLVRAGTVEQVQLVVRLAHAAETPLFVLGNGTNLLVSDRGLRGLVLQLNRELASAHALPGSEPVIVQAGAGTKLTVLLKKALRHGWAGLEVFAGIPGSVGGAVRMNAGAHLGETRDVLHEVDLVLADGALRTLPASELRMAYRTSALPPGAVVVRARFQTQPHSVEAVRDQVQTHLEHRAQTQPLDQPSCGSTFRNPPGDHAGRLIEAAGLKGHRIGNAQISPKHANFIVNLGGARADDVRSLIEHIQRTVYTQFGVALQREVHLAGDWSHWPDPT